MSKPPLRRVIMVSGASVALLGLGVILLQQFGPVGEEPGPGPVVVSTYVAPPELNPSPLTGIEVSPDLAARSVVGVMIENSIDARPQAGLEQAGVVFEAIAEGGITRFLALYQESRPSNIGPIRSARPYYVDWVAGFDAGYVHSGGSPEALSNIRTLGIKDLDHGNYDTRIASRVDYRFAPHNVFSNMDTIDTLSRELGYTTSSFTPFTRRDNSETALTGATSVSFNISSSNYNTSYTYDAESNDYKRNMAGIAHSDQVTGEQISPEVVVALITTYGIHPNGIHSVYGTIGSGDVLVFQEGGVQRGTWSKSSPQASLELKDSAGQPLELIAGQTWITAIQSEGKITYN